MTAQPLPFGMLLRQWRQQRRMTQLDLALAAGSSTRHLSCLETGRAQPSREMIAQLSACMSIPLREQNALLLAAGFAPAFQERALEELQAARQAMDTVLRAHLPYPAFAVDRHWNVILSNSALPELYEGCAQELLLPPVNAVRLILHPQGMASRILNYAEWRAHTLQLLRAQARACPDPGVQSLIAEVMSYPSPADGRSHPGFQASQRLATPLVIATRFGTVSFLNTLTVFGTPNDVTLAELALEMLFPADSDTAAVVRQIERERQMRLERQSRMG